MDIPTLTRFFMWCTILNVAVFTFWGLCLACMPELVYRLQQKFFPLPRETYNVVIYAFMAAFKIVFVVFCLVPYLALLIIGSA